MNRDHGRSVRQFFDSTAESYSGLFRGGRSGSGHCFGMRRRIAGELARGIGGRFLDCAVGSGEVAGEMLRAGTFSEATLVDVSGPMLSLAEANLRGAVRGEMRFVRGDIFEFLSERSGVGYDCIACLGLLAHVGRGRELLGLLADALGADGRIVLQATLAEHWGVALHRSLTARRYRARHGYAISYQTSGEIARWAGVAGLEIERVRRYCMGIPFGDRIWPLGNCWLERWFEPWSRRFGSEALFLLRRVLPRRAGEVGS